MVMNLHKISSELEIVKVFLISHRLSITCILAFFLSWSDCNSQGDHYIQALYIQV